MLIAFESRQKSFSSVDTNRRAAFAQQRSIANHRQPNPTPAIEQLPQDVEKINFCHSRAKARSASARFFARAWRTPVSAIEQLPQNLVHGLAVLRRLRRWPMPCCRKLPRVSPSLSVSPPPPLEPLPPGALPLEPPVNPPSTPPRPPLPPNRPLPISLSLA